MGASLAHLGAIIPALARTWQVVDALQTQVQLRKLKIQRLCAVEPVPAVKPVPSHGTDVYTQGTDVYTHGTAVYTHSGGRCVYTSH
jgi:hypothetical protein